MNGRKDEDEDQSGSPLSAFASVCLAPLALGTGRRTLQSDLILYVQTPLACGVAVSLPRGGPPQLRLEKLAPRSKKGEGSTESASRGFVVSSCVTAK